MRKGLLTLEQKRRLNGFRDEIIKNAEDIDFSSELGTLLPQDQQAIVKDFKTVLLSELKRQTG
ncbi:MAG: hypothetical protein AUK06_02570 [Parcubacteria group bacterium CG2_30_36_18]|nr:MAG: hypothetical protein AUK06_02570 [Parcubacteria group bacterium CG2_30_36_18]